MPDGIIHTPATKKNGGGAGHKGHLHHAARPDAADAAPRKGHHAASLPLWLLLHRNAEPAALDRPGPPGTLPRLAQPPAGGPAAARARRGAARACAATVRTKF